MHLMSGMTRELHAMEYKLNITLAKDHTSPIKPSHRWQMIHVVGAPPMIEKKELVFPGPFDCIPANQLRPIRPREKEFIFGVDDVRSQVECAHLARQGAQRSEHVGVVE